MSTDSSQLSNPKQNAALRVSDGMPTVEQRILDMLHTAQLENVDSVRAAADGYCVTFTGAGKYLITDALRAAVENAGLKIVASNGKSLVVAAPKAVTDGSDAHAHFAKGDTAIRKSDGVEFKVTDVRGDCISGVGTRVKTVKKEGKTTEETIPVYVEMAHRKHFRRAEEETKEAVSEKTDEESYRPGSVRDVLETLNYPVEGVYEPAVEPTLTPMQQAEQIASTETSEQTIAHVDSILAKPEELITDDERRYMSATIGWDYDKQISADDIEDDAGASDENEIDTIRAYSKQAEHLKGSSLSPAEIEAVLRDNVAVGTDFEEWSAQQLREIVGDDDTLDDSAPEPFADDDLYPPDPLDYTPTERKQMDEDFAREIYKQADAEDAGDIIEMPELTPEERFALTAYADGTQPPPPETAKEAADEDTAKLPPVAKLPTMEEWFAQQWSETLDDPEPTVEPTANDEDTTPLPAAVLEAYERETMLRNEIRELRELLREKQERISLQIGAIARFDADLKRALQINRDLAEQLADERMINAARKELVEMLSEQAQNPDPEPKTVECEETFETPPAEYARRINGQWKVAYQQRDGGKLYVMWVKEVVKPSDQLEAAINAALDRVQLPREDPFATVPKDVIAKTLESITS